MVEARAIDRAEGRMRERAAMPAGRIVAALAVALCVTPATAQPYPNRPITLVVPLPPGGTNDIMARAVADKLSASLGQQVVIENRAAGGSGSVGTRQVAHGASPDGYTILLGYTSTLATGPSLFRNAGYDPRKDFAPIGLIASAPALLLVHPSFAARNVKELIAIMKSSSEPFQLGTPGTGTVNYLAAVLFAQQADVKVQYIPYKGSNALNTDLIGGHVKVGFNPVPVSRAALEGGLIRALAGTSLKRSTALPDLPTVAESGLPGFDAVLTYGLVAPAGTPRPIIERLNRELNAALATDEVKKRLHQEGAEPMPTTPEEHAAVIDREETKWSTLVKSAGLKAE
jgi:tripartite-type tricarboxylate transporter receptor subunit TctC